LKTDIRLKSTLPGEDDQQIPLDHSLPHILPKPAVLVTLATTPEAAAAEATFLPLKLAMKPVEPMLLKLPELPKELIWQARPKPDEQAEPPEDAVKI
jgi:hypothetical protein